MTRLTAQELYARMCDLAPTRDPGAAVELAEQQWPYVNARRASPEDAETCRLTTLAALVLGDTIGADVWRARALARFSLVGWQEGVAWVVFGTAFRLMARTNNDYAAGTTLDVLLACDEAVAVFAELIPFTQEPGSGKKLGPSSPSPELVRRWYWEKLGALLLVSRDFEAARAHYAGAIEAAEPGDRGLLKVRLGSSLVEYVRAIERGEDPRRAVAMTQALVEEARESDQLDLHEIGLLNLQAMTENSLAVRLYEIL